MEINLPSRHSNCHLLNDCTGIGGGGCRLPPSRDLQGISPKAQPEPGSCAATYWQVWITSVQAPRNRDFHLFYSKNKLVSKHLKLRGGGGANEGCRPRLPQQAPLPPLLLHAVVQQQWGWLEERKGLSAASAG